MKYKILTLAFSLFSLLLQAQTIKTYSGPYGKGTATYQYYEDNNGERVYHGSFNYKGLEGTMKIAGAYKNGKRNGSWLCTLTDYYYIVMTMSGTIQTNYSNGNREGIWAYSLSKDVSKFDVSGKETETGKITFKNNVAVGEYFYSLANKVNSNAGRRETNTHIKGAFDENGYKTGEWNIQSIKNNLPTEEVKKYKKGYCYWYISRISSTGEINKKFDSTEYANNYFSNADEIFTKDKINYALSTTKGSEIEKLYEAFIGTQGVNPIIDNTGDRLTIEDKDGLTLGEFIGSLGWYAFLNGHLEKSLELSNKSLTYDSSLLFVKLNIALIKLKQGNTEYLNDYYSAVACCKEMEGRKETLQAGIKDINDLTEKENVPNADRAIKIIENELEKIKDAETALAIQKQKENQEQKEKKEKEQQQRIELANSDYGKIINEIKIELNRWERKSQFENDIDYQNRLKSEKENQFSKIKEGVLQKFKSLNQSLSNDNLSLVGQISKYDPENKILIIRPTILGSGSEKSVAVAVSTNYNKSLSDDYNKVARNTTYSLNISSDLAQTIYSGDDKKEILIMPKEFTLYNNNWHISKAFIIFNFDHSPGTVKSIIATDKSVSIDVDVFIPAKNAVLINIPSRTKTKTIELLKFADLENDFKQLRTLPEKIYYYYWTLDNEPNFSKEKVKEFNISITDIENKNN